MSRLLKLKQVNKAFASVKVLQDVDLTVDAGHVVALTGENGAGKSTLMKIITGIYKRDSGIVAGRLNFLMCGSQWMWALP